MFISQSLKEFIRNETVPSPIDIANNAIDDHLAKRLTELCGYGKKLVVGSAQYKAIIEMNLVSITLLSFLLLLWVNNIDHDLTFQGITCLHVDVPDCEIIVWR
mgnify:CR=1 FL=1